MRRSVYDIANETGDRLRRFNEIRRGAVNTSEFWDVVVLTAADESQKDAYELQLQLKLELKELPTAKYIVVADPKGPKIGNGGSTLVVIDNLVKEYGGDILDKKIIIVHAGGFSQRLPSASILGKAFLGTPIGEPLYQALEVKLMTYLDFPGKISSGGIFVCCADSIEVYSDAGIRWHFAPEGFTALAHLSPTSVGKTHGVFVLAQPTSESSIVWSCKQFLHKPSIEKMRETENCIVLQKDREEWVMTDSAFFISKKAAQKLLNFYLEIFPLTCEVDAYGDFLQALGTHSSPSYVENTKNVCYKAESLLETRQCLYNALKNTSLYAIVMSHPPKLFSGNAPMLAKYPESIFYHIGTLAEYQCNFCQDNEFRAVLSVSLVTSCSGMPFSFPSKTCNQESSNGSVKISKRGGLSCSIQEMRYVSPCLIGSVIESNVLVGEGTILEYCHVSQNASIGNDCVISNCCFFEGAIVPDGVFMHTTSIMQNSKTAFVTVLFEVTADLKKSVPVENALRSLTYFGKQLIVCFPDGVQSSTPEAPSLSLWDAKLFPPAPTMRESCKKACDAVHQLTGGSCNTYCFSGPELFSMRDLLQLKDPQSILQFRTSLMKSVRASRTFASYLSN